MTTLPAQVRTAWDDRDGPAVLSTIDESGSSNIVYVGCVSLYGENTIVIADNRFDKTRANLLRGCKGSFLFLTKDRVAYQCKGKLEYHTDGAIYDDMKTWLPSKYPGYAAAVLVVEEVYSGAEKLS